MHPALSHVRTWVFDLDNTLYPPSSRLFDQIEVRMTDWVARALDVDRPTANHLRDHYWKTYGTTLAGMMREHGADPGPYLTDVHDIDLSGLVVDTDLVAGIAALPGRRVVYTNGARDYAHRVIAARGLTDAFDAVYSVEDAGYRPKPEAEAFAAVFALEGLDPLTAAMFEDDARNLAVPHALGMACIHVAPVAEALPHVHHHTADLTAFVTGLTRG
jgi:putative hydrolase of the HAD superfamily